MLILLNGILYLYLFGSIRKLVVSSNSKLVLSRSSYIFPSISSSDDQLEDSDSDEHSRAESVTGMKMLGSGGALLLNCE